MLLPEDFAIMVSPLYGLDFGFQRGAVMKRQLHQNKIKNIHRYITFFKIFHLNAEVHTFIGNECFKFYSDHIIINMVY